MSVASDAFQKFHEYIHGGEPAIRQWFLLGSFKEPLLIAASYVLFVKWIGPAIMKHRKPLDLRNVMIPYNICLVAFYIYFLLRGILFVWNLKWTAFCGQLRIGNDPFIAKIYTLCWQLYMIKYVELLDTVFLVLKKKFNMATTLHVTHHAIVPIFGYIGFRSETSTYHSIFIGINSFVHVIMYSYYGVSLLGKEYQKYLWWKKYLTLLQISQFVFITIYIWIMAYLGCSTSKGTLYFTLFLCILFCVLFVNYYRKTFVHSAKQDHFSKKEAKLTNQTETLFHNVVNGKGKPEEKVR